MTDRITTARDDFAGYDAGRNYFSSLGYEERLRDCWDFYRGKQWAGFPTGDVFGRDGPPYKNVIRSAVQYNVSTIGQNDIRIIYIPMAINDKSTGRAALGAAWSDACERLTGYASAVWEQSKMDSQRWKVILAAAVTGNGYLYFYSPDNGESMKTQTVPGTRIFFANENEPDLQEQEYIIIAERLPLKAVREMAKADGATESEIEMIRADGAERDGALSDEAEQELEKDENNGNVLLLTRFWRENGRIKFRRSVRELVIVKDTETGLKRYPIAGMPWSEVEGSARADGLVWGLIPNQVELNKTLARRAITALNTAYPKVVYNETFISNAAELNKAGAKIAVSGNGMSVGDIVGYLNPASMSADVQRLSADLETAVMDMGGTNEAALGKINPETASGKAIFAVQDATGRTLSMQSRQHAQFAEDCALIFLDFWRAYQIRNDRLSVFERRENGWEYTEIPKTLLDSLEVSVKIEISPTSPFSQLAREQSLENHLAAKNISFAEYVEALPPNAITPKDVLDTILRKRAEAESAAKTQQAVPETLPNQVTPEQIPPEEMPEEEMPEQLPEIDPSFLQSLLGAQ